MRNVLNTIALAVAVLKREKDPGSRMQWVDDIEKAANEGLDIIEACCPEDELAESGDPGVNQPA